MQIFTFVITVTLFSSIVNAQYDIPSPSTKTAAAELAKLTLFHNVPDDRMPQVDVLTILLSFSNNESLLASLQQVMIPMSKQLDSLAGGKIKDTNEQLKDPSLMQERHELLQFADKLIWSKDFDVKLLSTMKWKLALTKLDSFVTSIQEVVQLMTKLIFLGNPSLAPERIQKLKLLLREQSEIPLLTEQAKAIKSLMSKEIAQLAKGSNVKTVFETIEFMLTSFAKSSNKENPNKESFEKIQDIMRKLKKLALLDDSSLAPRNIEMVNQLPSVLIVLSTDELNLCFESLKPITQVFDELIERLIVKPAFGILDA